MLDSYPGFNSWLEKRVALFSVEGQEDSRWVGWMSTEPGEDQGSVPSMSGQPTFSAYVAGSARLLRILAVSSLVM